uniref:Uncharacterized protein n=1 Tax=Arundo donax TaxID=35708 RepID=A0A0A9DG44_ARUDO
MNISTSFCSYPLNRLLTYHYVHLSSCFFFCYTSKLIRISLCQFVFLMIEFMQVLQSHIL